jgi:membrane protease YdiL (CAAX protease family)
LPEWPQPVGIHLVGVVALLLFANVIVNEVLGPPWYVPFNLTVLGVALLLARGAGTTWDAMGMSADRLRRGAAVGGLIGIVIVALFFAAVMLPAAREAFRDDRIIEGSIGLSLYHALFRVPIGTALYEEVLFRGIVFGMLARRTSALAAALWSSLLFGVWHVLPALEAIETNPIGDAFGGSWEPVVAAVISTFVAGLVFVWIRLYSGSIIAPIIVHVASNSTAIVASALVVHIL